MAFLWPYYVFCVFFFLGYQTSFAQSYPNFENLTTKDGLSSNKIESILQDKEGFYWIATQNGLNRYDGTTFRVFRHREDDPSSLTHDYCTALAEDSNGDIWVATYRGISRYLKNKGSFRNYFVSNNTQNFETANRIFHLIVDKENDIWIGGAGLWKYDRELDSIIFFQKTDKPVSISDDQYIGDIVYDSIHHGLWLRAVNGINYLNIRENIFYHAGNNPDKWKIFNLAIAGEICLGHGHKIWFRDSSMHLSSFDPKSNVVVTEPKKLPPRLYKIKADPAGKLWMYDLASVTQIYHPAENRTDTNFFKAHHRRSMQSDRMTSLFVDKKNNYWIGTNKGISIYHERNQFYHLHKLEESSQEEREPLRILAIAQTANDFLWISTNTGLLKYNLTNKSFKRISGLPPTLSFSALCADGNKLWMSTNNQLLCLHAESGNLIKSYNLPPTIIFIHKGNNNDLWVGLWAGGLYRIDLSSDEIKHFINVNSDLKTNSLVACNVEQEVIWIGYNNGNGFAKYNTISNSFINYHPPTIDAGSIAAGTITVIARDSLQQLWLGTYGSGLIQFEEKDQRYTYFLHDHGLKSNYINSIIPDKGGNLWISTAEGMNYLKSGTRTIDPLDIDFVFQSNSLVTNGLKSPDGKIFFFCYDEFVEIDPTLYQADFSFPRVVISNFKILNKEVPILNDRSLQLSHRENFFSFEFSALKTLPAKPMYYSYMLKGFDKDWNDAGQKNFAAYTNVPGGKYEFMVRTRNTAGEWGKPSVSIPIIVQPPFWLTWWFFVLSFALLAAMAYGIYKYRINQIKKIYLLKSKISQDLHDDVGASLSSIHIHSSVAEKAIMENPQRAIKLVRQISHNSRQVMDNMSDIIWAMNAGESDAESLVGRIKNIGYDLLSQKNIECHYQIEEAVERKLLMPDVRKKVFLIVKEAINNMAKYSEASEARVSLTMNGSSFLIEIKDNGKGFEPDKITWGNGLRNIRQRTEMLGGSFHLQSSPGGGTKLVCLIPLTKISDGQPKH